MKCCVLNTPTKLALACSLVLASSSAMSEGASYASGISFVTPTQVSFILNEPADVLSISINGAAPFTLDGTTSGLKTFNLPSASATFSITAVKNDSVGYTIPTGNTIAPVTNGLSQPAPEVGFRPISDDANTLNRFNSPRGVTVATNPNNPQFGTAYISNSAAGTNAASGRTLGDGLYALRANQSDAFGYGDTAQANGLTVANSANSPFRLSIGPDHNVYIADFSDANGTVWRMNGILTTGRNMLEGVGGPTTLPFGQNHGSTTAVFVSGSANGTLSMYTVDEDLTSSQVNGGSSTDRNSVWRYDFDAASNTAISAMPVKVNQSDVLVPAATSDMDVGANGNFYLAQTRNNGLESGIFVLDPNGNTLFSSLSATRSLLNDPGAIDIFRYVNGIAVSPDQKWLAVILNNSDVAVLPLDNLGIPIFDRYAVIDTGTDINSGRDIAFDAAGNIHYVSSGQGLYRVLVPGGFTQATTSWNGTSYNFTVVPEPSTVALLAVGAVLGGSRRRRRPA